MEVKFIRKPHDDKDRKKIHKIQPEKFGKPPGVSALELVTGGELAGGNNFSKSLEMTSLGVSIDRYQNSK